LSSFDPLGVDHCGGDTFGTGVNSNVDTIGYGSGGWFAKHIELNEGVNDTEVKPSFITVAYPGAAEGTIPFGLNDRRWIVGIYYDSTGKQHGFLAKPNF